MDDVKTEYSHDYVPLHPSLTKIVLAWSKQAVPTAEGWVFANPMTNRPYHPTKIQKRHLRAFRILRGRMSDVWSGAGRVVLARKAYGMASKIPTREALCNQGS